MRSKAIAMQPPHQLETLGREELLQTVRHLLAEADALSSRISVLNEIGLAVNQSLDLERIQRIIAKQAKWLLDFEYCSVCLQNNDQWQIRTLFGKEDATHANLATMPNMTSVFNTSRSLILREGMESGFLAGYQSQLIIPLIADGVFLGTINFAMVAPNCYRHEDLRIGLMLSLQLSSAIRNAKIVADLKATREELNMRVEELDAYGHTIAHDLKSPLASVLLRSQLIAMHFKDEIPPKVLDMVGSIEQSSKVMKRMIDQLLLLTQAHYADQRITLVNIQATLNEALSRFSYQIQEQGIHIEISSELPNAYGQAQWVEEIFANLISNAIKYMGEDNPLPQITITAQAQTHRVRYQVRDTGVGIKTEDLGRLFKMFSRVHTNSGIEGLGLGLSIVQRIIRKLNGDIGVESIYGEGTMFWFTLPTTLAQTGSLLE